MPTVERTIQSSGVEIDYVHYYGPELKKWVGARKPGTKRSRTFMFARDPRDISRVFFFDPEDAEYVEIPYLNTSHGPISLWELRLANQRLMAEGRKDIDERLLFEKHLELLDNAHNSSKKTKAARRQVQRSAKQRLVEKTAPEAPSQIEESDVESAEPFDDLPVVPFDDEEGK